MGKNKFSAKKVEIDGYKFDSKAEAKRYGELKLLGSEHLTVHPAFDIVINTVKVCTVVLDFYYLSGNRFVYEDVKGCDTPISRLKRKLVEAQYGIKVELIKT